MGINSIKRSTPRRGKKPGPKPGTRHAGSFKPGDPRINYAGYTKEMRMKNKALEDIARDHAEEAVSTLVDLLRTGSDGVKRAAAEALLDRAYGKPIDRQAVLQMGTGKETDGTQLSRAQLLRIASGALAADGTGGQVIDLQVVSGDDEGEVPPR